MVRNMLCLNSTIQDSDPTSIHKDARVCLAVLRSQGGITAINVRTTELPSQTAQSKS
jgi:hypothetical protein